MSLIRVGSRSNGVRELPIGTWATNSVSTTEENGKALFLKETGLSRVKLGIQGMKSMRRGGSITWVKLGNKV